MAGRKFVYICELCQTELEEHQCKAICPNCGRMLDCSDLPVLKANGEAPGPDAVPAAPLRDAGSPEPPFALP